MNSRQLLHRLTLALLALGAAVATLVLAPNQATACGGTFCSQNQPVNQAAENIIFSQNDDGTVTAVVQIMYQGPSDEFAWLLPVTGTPEVGVSSGNAIQRLQNVTRPQFNLTTTVEGTCARPEVEDSFDAGNVQDTTPTSDAGSSDSGVTVVDEGTVGPYDYTTISVDEASDDPAQAAIDWLTDNSYDLMGTGPDLIRDYLEDGMNLIAFKLTKSANTGDIRPVSLTYPGELPMIPIKLTAVAANADMGVRVWVLGEDRAIPSNYKSLELNWSALNWLRGGSNYNTVVSLAADEANGQGFVTEYADDASTLDQIVWSDRENQSWEQINTPSNWEDAHGELLVQTIQRYRQFDGMVRAIDQTVPLPSGSTPADLLAAPRAIYDETDTQIDGFSAQIYLEAVQENVIDPMRDTEALIDSRPYISRLYTTMSAAEMTLDPLFDFNPTLEDVDNVHEADRTIYCSEHVTRSQAPWKTVLPDGQEVHGVGNTWPIRAGDNAPATETIRQDNNMGDGEVVEDNSDEISSTLADINDAISLDPADHGDESGDDVGGTVDDAGAGADTSSGSDTSGGSSADDVGGGGGGCSTTGDSLPAGVFAVLVLMGGVFVRRRET